MQPDTKETPGALDAFQTLKPGERHWTLQSGDPLSPVLMELWADLARVRAGAITPKSFTERLADKMLKPVAMVTDPAEAEELLLRATNTEQMAWEFSAWQKGHVHEDERTAERMKGESEADAAWRLAHFNLQTHIVERLNNATAEANDQIERMEQLGDKPSKISVETAKTLVRDAVYSLKRASELLTPKRNR